MEDFCLKWFVVMGRTFLDELRGGFWLLCGGFLFDVVYFFLILGRFLFGV